MSTFILFELRYWLKRPMLYIFFLVFALFAFGFLDFDFITIGSGRGITHANAPLIVQTLYGALSVLGLVAITSFFNATATRDYTSGMDQIVFASPIKKIHFFFGKFFGAFLVAILPYTGIALVALISPYMPWVDPTHYGPFSWQANVNGFLMFSAFNTLFGGAIIYAFAIYFRNPVLSYIASFGIIVLNVMSNVLTRDIENQHLAMLLDPMGQHAFNIFTKYWSPAQRNTGYVSLSPGLFLVNRLLWGGIGLAILFWIYWVFDFTQARNRPPSRPSTQPIHTAPQLPHTATPQSHTATTPAVIHVRRPAAAWFHQFAFELKSITRNNAFIILTSIGLLNLIIDLSFSTGNFGQKNLPVTYSVAELISANLWIFIMAFIIFYSGYIVFREKEVKLDEIVDATPVSNGYVVTTKLAAVLISITIIQVVALLFGMLYQLFNGFTNFEIGVYIRLFALDLLGFAFMLVAAYFIQLLVNNKYIGYFVIVAFLIANNFLWQAMRVESNMVRFGKLPTVLYSDMNGFGPFVPGIIGFGLYWSLFCSLLILAIIGMNLRGKENNLRPKVARLAFYLKGHVALPAVLLALFLTCGGWLYYNTKVLNTYISAKERDQQQADYEKKYKKDAALPLPFTTALNYTIDLFPAKRSLHVHVEWWVKNVHPSPITILPFNMPIQASNDTLTIPGAVLTMDDQTLRYRTYTLQKPLQPGDSIRLAYSADFVNRGIENEVSFTQITRNGSFFHDNDILPVIGYSSREELTNALDRRKYKLPQRQRLARLSRICTDTCNTSYINNSAAWVDLSTTISTSDDQIAIAPGSLVTQWHENGRNYYTYHLQHKALNFFSFIAANYLVKRDSIDHVAIEIYYDKHHPYNVDRMVSAVKKSLHYYTTNFGPYYQQECRIIEFPRYAGFAQSFPGTMPYSESIGFINDLRDTSTIDLVTYVVSHEMGHQWWAHQVIGPAMQGSESFSEGLAQYSALMVMKKEYGPQKMSRFLKYELDDYLRGRAQEKEYENPLMRTEGQSYIHYSKASLVYYYLQEMIGEQQLDAILKNIVTKYAYTDPPFPTAFNVVDELKAGTPDSLSYLISDMFENITLFNNSVDSATVTKIADHRFQVKMKLLCEKIRCDSLGNEHKVPINDYIDVGIFERNRQDGSLLGNSLMSTRIKIHGDTTLTFIVSKWPYQVGVDPYHYLIDKVTEDNLKIVF
jgi:ABC-type transport system involved in multi-copper enzyme maturation permease subunit